MEETEAQMGSAHEEVAIHHYVAPAIMSAEQNQPFNLGESIRKSKVHEEWLEMYSKDAGNDKFEHSLLSIHRQPCPNRKEFEVEEMVKYSIPCYLQCEEKGLYNIQEKVLNVDVLDWRCLQKWQDHETQLATNKMNHDSPPLSNLSTFHSSPFSSRSNASLTHERKQSSSFSSTSSLASSTEKDQINVWRKDSSKDIIKSRDVKDIIGSFPSAYKGSRNLALLHSNESTKAAGLDELEKLQINIEQDGSRSHLNQDGGRPKHRRKHLEEIIARSILSFDAAFLDQGNLTRMNSSRLSGNLSLPPHSSTPSSNTHREDPHDACIPPSPECSGSSTNNTKIGANRNPSFKKGRELLPIVLPRVDLKGVSGSPLKSIVHNPPNDAISRSSSTRRRSPMRLFFDHSRNSTSSIGSILDNLDVAGARSNNSGRRSSVKQILLDPDASVSRSNSRGRHSPLRQMLESPRKSSLTSVNFSQQPQDSCSVVDPIHSSLIRQALLKLYWRNGLPLLMFSSSDDSILVAMMHKRGNPDMNICNCVYEIHTAMAIEAKKKNGAWLSQGTKNKKSEFNCKFVAELIVSSSERVSFDLTHRSFIRELVLLGDELFPSLSSNQNHDDATNSSSRTELAAIVVESSHQKLGSPNCGNLCSPCIVAILPSGVHGFSNTREPSNLIEKWESGGACDCGGWDEGCELTILTNNTKKMSNVSIIVQDCGDIIDHGNSGFDLFTEGDARKGMPSFSMVSFKEDMFTVEFKASIPLLQAFAISIAMMHDQNHLISMDNFEDLSFDSYPIISS